MSSKIALTGARIFDGEKHFAHHSLLVKDGLIAGICSADDIPSGPNGYQRIEIENGLLAPGFIDLQVNGGGGVLFNQTPTLQGIETICGAHHPFGTTGLLPTLITDKPEITERAIQAGIEAAKKQVPGFLGLHLEGPHLSVARKGAHDPKLIRPMQDEDCQQLIAARSQLPNLMVTVAPESVSNAQISQLADVGIIVSLGHSNTSYEEAELARRAGASCMTHLYNAMSPISHRQPGMVGAGLAPLGFHCGLIADGYHVDPAVISISLAAKNDAANIFLVSDAMSTIGSDQRQFDLNGRTIFRSEGRLTLADGTLAGADLELNTAVRYMVETVGLDLDEALRMASLYPAQCLGNPQLSGTLAVGQVANIIRLDERLKVQQVWMSGEAL
ncbi:MAG: N-acetylglucosamine-6-phosphate deacetylase [Rhizobiaceae bacterium]|nr:N-acetylglucosamine-6-phosphate deacetylase [Rhizobiaceae bacterium]